MSVINIAFLGFALFFIVKAILAPNWRSSGTCRGRLDAFSKDAYNSVIVSIIITVCAVLLGLFIVAMA